MVERKNRYIRNKNILFALLMAGFALGFLHLGMPKGRVVVCKADYFVFLSEGNMIFGTFFSPCFFILSYRGVTEYSELSEYPAFEKTKICLV